MRSTAPSEATPAHRRFLERLRESQVAVDAVAAWLRSRGHRVEVFPQREAPAAELADEFSDLGDLRCQRRGFARWRVADVKFARQSGSWTSTDEWPWPWVFLGTASRASTFRPDDYFVLGPDLSHALWISGHTTLQVGTTVACQAREYEHQSRTVEIVNLAVRPARCRCFRLS